MHLWILRGLGLVRLEPIDLLNSKKVAVMDVKSVVVYNTL